MQEIGIKLKADTTMAEKSVKELESKIKNISKATSGTGAIVDDVDIKNFQKMNNELDRFVKRLGGLSQSLKQQQTALPGVGGSGFKGLGVAAGAMSSGVLMSQIRQGMNMIKNEEKYSADLGTRLGGYGSDFRRTRLDFTATGGKFNTNAMDTMQTANTFMSLAGAGNIRGKTADILRTSKGMGLDANYLANSYGSFSKMGTQDLQKLSESLTGAIKKTGMAGRETELIDALNKLTDSAYQNQLSISDKERNNLLGVTSYFGMKNSSLKGDKGAQLAGGLDNIIKSSDSNDELLAMMGYGSKYKGTKGYWDLQKKVSKGLTDPGNLKDLMSGLSTWQADPSMKKVWLNQQLKQQGVNNPEMVDFLMRPDIQKDIQSGKVTKETLDSIGKSGKASFGKQFKDRMGSNTEQRSSWDNFKEYVDKSLAEPVDYLKNAITGLIQKTTTPEVGAGLLTAGTLGGSVVGGALLRGGAKNFFGKGGKGGGGSFVGDLWKGTKSFAGRVYKGGASLLEGASNFRAPELPFLPIPSDLLNQIFGGNNLSAMNQPKLKQTGMTNAYGYGSPNVTQAYGYGSMDSTRTLEARRSDLLNKEMNVLQKRESLLSLEGGGNLGQIEKVVSHMTNSTQDMFNKQTSMNGNGMMNLMRLSFGGSSAIWNGQTAKAMQSLSTNNTNTTHLKVSGNIGGLTPANNNAVTTALVNKVNGTPDLRYIFKQGPTAVTL